MRRHWYQYAHVVVMFNFTTPNLQRDHQVMFNSPNINQLYFQICELVLQQFVLVKVSTVPKLSLANQSSLTLSSKFRHQPAFLNTLCAHVVGSITNESVSCTCVQWVQAGKSNQIQELITLNYNEEKSFMMSS